MHKGRTSDGIAQALLWRPVRWSLVRMLAPSARKVLLIRELTFTDGSKQRWLKPDLKQFLTDLQTTADDLRDIAELERLPSAGNRLLVEFAVFTAAAYRVLLGRDVEPSQARELVSDIGWDVYARMLSLASLPFRLTSRDPGVRLRRTIRFLLWFPFNLSHAPGYEAKVWVEGEDIHTHFTHCPPQSFVRRLIEARGDEGDLEAFQQSWCAYDWPVADVIAGDGRRGHYQRRRTMSYGDDVCDMCWAARAGGDTPA